MRNETRPLGPNPINAQAPQEDKQDQIAASRNYDELFKITDKALEILENRFYEANKTTFLGNFRTYTANIFTISGLAKIIDTKKRFLGKVGARPQAHNSTYHTNGMVASSIENLGLLLFVAGSSVKIGSALTKKSTKNLLDGYDCAIISNLFKEVWTLHEKEIEVTRAQSYFKKFVRIICEQNSQSSLNYQMNKVKRCWLQTYINFLQFERKYLTDCVGSDIPTRMWLDFHARSNQSRLDVEEEIPQMVEKIDQKKAKYRLDLNNLFMGNFSGE